LNNQVLASFSDDDRQRIGVHTCPGGDQDSTHSADIDYAGLLPELFSLNVGSFYMQMASEPSRSAVLEIVRANLPQAKVFIGVTDPINPRIESPEDIRDQIVEAATFIPLEQLGTTDDCGFSPFGDDTSTSRDVAFGKISARIAGTELASSQLEG
jgi:5-methyltetrahydropteroyltriglutamate--homocysteine methyltransferase